MPGGSWPGFCVNVMVHSKLPYLPTRARATSTVVHSPRDCTASIISCADALYGTTALLPSCATAPMPVQVSTPGHCQSMEHTVAVVTLQLPPGNEMLKNPRRTFPRVASHDDQFASVPFIPATSTWSMGTSQPTCGHPSASAQAAEYASRIRALSRWTSTSIPEVSIETLSRSAMIRG